jgi:FkbH-like protein
MSAALYTELGWLRRPPADFGARCKALAMDPTPGAACRALAGYGLDEGQAARLGRAIMTAAREGRSLAPLIPVRLGVVGTGTQDLLLPILVASAARHGMALDCICAEYGQITQAALDPASRINAARPDALLLALDYRSLVLPSAVGDSAVEQAAIDGAMATLAALRDGFARNGGAVCIVPTLAPPPELLFGSFDRLVAGTTLRVIEGINRAIVESVAGSGDVLLDVASLAQTVGLGTWHSPADWNMAKLPVDPACLPIYCEHVARLLAAVRGRSRKCLILDLDNTLWGGVIGDDGLEGIRIAQGDAEGEAYRAVQQLALSLRARGIVLAVCSKNTDAVARLPFREHPEMLLRETDFAVFQANWSDKATNIRAIAAQLGLGLEAMVLLDDNPTERDLVRRLLPEVAVPELPDDPALYARTLAAAGYFESVAFSGEDRERAENYRANATRLELREQAGDLDAYLAALGMQITFAPFDRVGRARISQLINKSNQFNLTGRRYSEAEVAAAEADPEVLTLQVRLTDRLSDNGMISVVICRPDGSGEVWAIDTWLMSCRVLGRGVEQMVLREILLRARQTGIRTLIGTYRPTERNALVRDHYRNLGFALRTEQADGTTVWTLPAATEVAAVGMAVRYSVPP